jgi:hypothetical protein
MKFRSLDRFFISTPFFPEFLRLGEQRHQFVSRATKPFDLVSDQVLVVGPGDFVTENPQPHDTQNDAIACSYVADCLTAKSLIEPLLDQSQFFIKKTRTHLYHLLSCAVD